MLGLTGRGASRIEDRATLGVRERNGQKPPGNGTVAPDGDDLHLEPVTVEGVGTVLVLDVRGRLAEVAEPAYLVRAARPGGGAGRCGVRHVGRDGAGRPRVGRAAGQSRGRGGAVARRAHRGGVPGPRSCARRWRRDRTAGTSWSSRSGSRRWPGCWPAGPPRWCGCRSSRTRARPVLRGRWWPTACDRWGMSSVSASATLVVSELVTNALPHAGSDVGLSVARCGSRLRVAVRDASSERPQPQPVEPSRPRGRGLLLVAAVADAWGVLPAGGWRQGRLGRAPRLAAAAAGPPGTAGARRAGLGGIGGAAEDPRRGRRRTAHRERWAVLSAGGSPASLVRRQGLEPRTR